MLEELLPHYEHELALLRELASEFARSYPKVARRLSLENEQSEDPHFERLMQSFAFLAAGLRRELDDEFSGISEPLLQVLYPHFIQPFPSCTILQFEINALSPEVSAKHSIPRHFPAISPLVDKEKCKFRTCYEVDLYPLTLRQTTIQLAQNSEYLRRIAPNAAAAITLEFALPNDASVSKIKLDRIRFFLDGDPTSMHLLYELLLMRALSVRVSGGADNNTNHSAQCIDLPATALRAVGFNEDEGLLNYGKYSSHEYRLLTEYFAFPEKFLFIDLCGLDAPQLQNIGATLRVQIFLSAFPDTAQHHRLAQTLSPANFKMGCTPAINLFECTANPIRVSDEHASYPIIVDVPQSTAHEVISINAITGGNQNADDATEVPPYYSIRHHVQREDQKTFWYATREPSTKFDDNGTEMTLSFVDIHFTPRKPERITLSIELTCSNRDLPAQLPFGPQAGGDIYFAVGLQILQRARILRKPTASIRPPRKNGWQWRMISTLSPNHLSIVPEGKAALQEMLALYNTGQSRAAARQIQGIISIDSQVCTTLVANKGFQGCLRGLDITLTLDEHAFTGTGIILFGAILERFFARYGTAHQFTRLTIRGNQGQEIAKWPVRTNAMHAI